MKKNVFFLYCNKGANMTFFRIKTDFRCFAKENKKNCILANNHL